MANGRKAPPVADFEIPDLDVSSQRQPSLRASKPVPATPPVGSGMPVVERSGVRAAAPRSASPQSFNAGSTQSKPRPAVEDYFGSANFDLDHFGGSDTGLTLDTVDDAGLTLDTVDDGPRSRAAGGRVDDGSGAAAVEVQAMPAVSLSGRPRSPAAEVAIYRVSDTAGAPFDDVEDAAHRKSGAPAVQTAEPGRLSVRVRWPTGVSPSAADLTVDHDEIAQLAGYGPLPASVFVTPFYAYRVFQRRRLLKARVRTLAAQLVRAERQRDERLAQLVRNLWDSLGARDDVGDLLSAIRSAEQTVAEQRGALAGYNAEFDRVAKSLASQLTDLDKQITEGQQREATKASVLADAELVLARLEAKKKRLYIEIRAIVDAAEKTGGTISREQSSKVQQLETLVAAMRPELDAAAEQVQGARAALDQVQKELGSLDRSADSLRREERSLNQRFEKQLGACSAELTAAEQQQLEAFAETGRRVLAMKGRVPVDASTLQTLTRSDEEVVRAATHLEHHAQALHAHDANAYRRGFIVVGVAALLLVGLLLAIALM